MFVSTAINDCQNNVFSISKINSDNGELNHNTEIIDIFLENFGEATSLDT